MIYTKKTYKQVSSTGFAPKGRFSKKQLTAIMLLLCIGCAVISGTLVYVFATPSTSTLYVEEGIYPGIPDYTIWREESTYYAKDRNGHIDSIWGTSSNACYVITEAINNLPTNLWGVKTGTIALGPGNFSLSATIQTDHAVVRLVGSGRFSTVLLPTSGAFNVLEIGNTSKVSGVVIENLHIWGSNSSTAIGIYVFRGRFLSIRNVQIEYMGGYGIVFNATMLSEIQNTRIEFCGGGVHLVNDPGTERSNGNSIIGGAINHLYSGTAVNITNSQGNKVGIGSVTDMEYCDVGVWVGGDGNSHWNEIGGWFEGNTLDINISAGSKNLISATCFTTFADTGTRTVFRPISQGFFKTGQATFPSGQTSYNWTHGLVTTPTRILVTFGTDIGNTRSYWVTANSTHIQLYLSSSAATNYAFYWWAGLKQES